MTPVSITHLDSLRKATRPPSKRVLIIGAGLSGLAAARAVQDAGLLPVVLEAATGTGGYTRSFSLNDFSFDYTGHLLHLRNYASPAAIPFANQRDHDWQRITRRSACLVDGVMVPAPIQYHMGLLPSPMRERCVESYRDRVPDDGSVPGSFAEYIIRGFGAELANRFLIPQNQKTMATSLDRLSPSAVKRFFPPPVDALVQDGIRAQAAPPVEYNSQFWYPKVGGIDLLVQGLSESLPTPHLGERVVAVDLPSRSLRTSSGTSFGWDAVISTVPLDALCRMTQDTILHHASRELTHSTTISIALGTRVPVADPLRDVHWVYTPDAELPFYRVGVYSNISEGVAPRGCASYYAEVGCAPSGDGTSPRVALIAREVITALGKLGWVQEQDIVCSAAHVLNPAYVHHTAGRERVLPAILTRLEDHRLFSIGRYGSWDYTSMEDSIVAGIDAARKVLACL